MWKPHNRAQKLFLVVGGLAATANIIFRLLISNFVRFHEFFHACEREENVVDFVCGVVLLFHCFLVVPKKLVWCEKQYLHQACFHDYFNGCGSVVKWFIFHFSFRLCCCWVPFASLLRLLSSFVGLVCWVGRVLVRSSVVRSPHTTQSKRCF